MRLIEQLKIGSEVLHLTKTDIRLESNTPGRAVFTVKSKDPIDQNLVQFFSGASDDQLYPGFAGMVHTSQEINPGVQQLVCKELSALLEIEAKLSLRHLLVKDLLSTIEELTGLGFVVPDGDLDYLKKRIPYFYNMSTARAALEAAFAPFGVSRGIWSQLPTGKIYWGSWDDSPFAKMESITIDPKLITKRNPVDRSFQIPTIPALRPGMIFQESLIIESMEIKSEWTTVRWLKL